MTEQDKTREELRAQFIIEIKNNGHFKEFFKSYRPSSVERFIKGYALKKAMWTIHGPFFKKEMERMETQWVNLAMERIAEIQQVKLFLFQCRYRAGEIQERVEGVRTIFDFLYWKNNVLNASFLEPVTEDDISMYCRYMNEYDGNHNALDLFEDWQDFKQIRAGYNSTKDTDEEDMDEDDMDEDDIDEDDKDEAFIKIYVPAWYLYYFTYTGHGMELSLPDTKGEKDLFYFRKGNEERVRQAKEAEIAAIAKMEAKPKEEGEMYDEYGPEGISLFMSVFEDKHNRDMQKIYEAWGTFNETEDRLRDDLDVLQHAKEKVPIEAHEDWEYAIQLAAARYRTKKIQEMLPAAYEQYKMNLSLGISFPEHEQGSKDADFYNDMLLLGRKMMGEPEDFEY
jgi:hypothetical protein